MDEDLLPKSQDEILEQVKEEIEQSRDFVKTKRQTFRERLKLYNNQRKQRDKIGDTTLYNVMNTLLAVYYIDQPQASFSGREMGDISAAANVDNIAKFDYDEMELDVLNYLVQWDRFFFGVGIKEIATWDKNRKVPAPKSLDPLGWLPDPNGYLLVKNFRYNGFEVEYMRTEMTEEAGFFNIDQLSPKSSNVGSEQDQNRDFYREAQGLDNLDKNTKNKDSDVFDMIDHYTQIKGDDGLMRKYLVTVSEDLKTLTRCEEIQAVTKEEKDNLELVPFPITLHYFSPTRNDPFGVSVGDLVEDKQRAKSVLKNLRIATRKAAIYPMYLYNRDKILNRRDLDFAFNKFIAVRGDVGDNVVMPLNKAVIDQGGILNDEQSLDADTQVSTGADRITQGVMSDQQRTLGEVQQTMANANLKFMLGSRVNNWGEKRFWKLWYRMYRQNFQAGEQKIVRLSTAIGNKYSIFSRKDFITIQDPDIKIESKIELEQRRAKDRIAFSTIFPMVIQDPRKPFASKLYAERRMLRLYDVPEDEIAIISPETPDEIRARMENELLSRNEKVNVDVEREDHLSHMVVHSQAESTAATQAHILKHKEAYYASGQAQKDRELEMMAKQNAGGGQGGGVANSMANSMANQNANLNNASNQPIEVGQGAK